MATAGRIWPALIASGVGVVGGYYIFSAPLQEVSGKLPNKGGEATEGRSQAVLNGEHKSGASSQPHSGLKYGGASPVDPSKPTVAGTSPESRRGNSADHNVKTRTDTSSHDGTGGGGVGVAEMRERKMEGKGLPSPQGGDTKPQVVKATKDSGEGGGLPNKGKGRWWLGGW